RPLEAAADRPAIDGADNRLLSEDDRTRSVLNRLDELARFGLGVRMDVLSAVIPCTEGTTGAAEDHRFRRAVLICVREGLRHVTHKRVVHGIEAIWAVQRDCPHAFAVQLTQND